MSTTIAEPKAFVAGRHEVPFQHLVIDHWAEPELVRAAEAEWPRSDWPFWHRYECGKLATKDPLRFPPACAELIRRLLCLRIGELLGLDDTFADWNCHGAGLHHQLSRTRQHPMLDQQTIDRLGPWTTRFQLHGQTIGGTYAVSEDDPLLRAFLDHAPLARRVLELG